jgi:serine/threonine protein kinase
MPPVESSVIELMNKALAGRYRIESLAGRGGMATVYRAVDLRHDRAVALKVMHAEFAESIGRERFLREIRVTAGLSHPHLLALYDSGEVDGLLFYVMPFVDGVSLRQRLRSEARLQLDDVRKIVGEISDALSHAHARGIIHRDIKPENILLAGYTPGSGDRHRWSTLVADFGVSGLLSSTNEHLTLTGVAVGSPQYMSPEQAVGDPTDARSDVYALGCVTYEMLEGMPPRGVPSFQRTDVPANVKAAVLRALSQDVSERFADATELADAIGDNVSATRASRSRAARWIAAAVAVAAIGAAGMFSRSWSHAKPTVTRDSVALGLYRRAQSAAANRTDRMVALAIADYSNAIQRDSDFALAWAGLARAAQMSLLRGWVIPGRSPDSLLNLAIVASQRALSLDTSLAEIWLVRARVLESIDPTTRATVENHIRRALAIDSTNGDAWFSLGRAREERLDTAGARAAYARGLRYAPGHLEMLGFYALHFLWTNQPRESAKWADSALAIEPTYFFAREQAARSAIELRDWPRAKRHIETLLRIARGTDRVTAFAVAARAASVRGDHMAARRFALQAVSAVDSTNLSKHDAVYLGEAFAMAGDTARALHWLEAFSPRGDVHYQLHLQRDASLAWVHEPRYAHLLQPNQSSRD